MSEFEDLSQMPLEARRRKLLESYQEVVVVSAIGKLPGSYWELFGISRKLLLKMVSVE